MGLQIRASEQQQGGCGRIFGSVFFVIFLAAGLGFTVLMVKAALAELETYLWKETKCQIVSSEAIETGDTDSPYRAEVVYRYQATDGRSYESNQVSISAVSSETSYSDVQAIVSRYHPGDTTDCYVDPDQPSQAVLERGFPWILVMVLLPLVFVAVGAGGLWATWRAPRAKARQPISKTATDGKGKTWIPIAFGGVFVLVGGALFVFIGLLPWLRLIEARSWDETSCTVISSTVRSHDSDDGTTYSIDILYEYEYDRQTWKSNQYSFVSWSSSGYDGKAEVVDEYPPGTRTVCFVDPDDPSQAVLDRDFGWGYLVGLFPLIFVGAGLLVMRVGSAALAKKRKAISLSSEPAAVAEILPAAIPSSGPTVLKPTVSGWAKVIGMAVVAAFWNGIVSIFVFQLIESFRSGSPEWFLAVFLLPFVGIGLFMIGMIGYFALQSTNPRPRLVVSNRSPRLGDRVQVDWQFSGSVKRLTDLKIVMEGREEATYRRGTDTRTDKEVFAQLQIASTGDQHQMQRGTSLVVVPEDTMHSVSTDNNKIVWEIKVAGDIPRWPDIDESFEMSVRPRAESESAAPVTGGFGFAQQGVVAQGLEIITDHGATCFMPGSTIAGELRWSLADDAEALELRLFWHTLGRGTDDVGVVASQRIDHPGQSGSRRFAFEVPEGPYSFSGKLITLAWALELVQLPGQATTRLDLLVGSSTDEVDLRSGVRTC
jgi:hypothetical protein